jgi:hypothetical protein
MISEVASQMVEILSVLEICDKSRHSPLVWLLESAEKNRQTYFGAIIRVSQHSFEDSTKKKLHTIA